MTTTTKEPTNTDEPLVGINVLMPQSLHRKFKARIALDGQNLAEGIEAALTAYLGDEA